MFYVCGQCGQGIGKNETVKGDDGGVRRKSLWRSF